MAAPSPWKLIAGFVWLSGLLVHAAPTATGAACPDYSAYAGVQHPPLSSGRYKLSYMRPDPSCRTFTSKDVEQTVTDMKSKIKDPDLYRLFQNSFPNTLDTAIKWKGTAADNSKEELTFVITGDIDAMWLRDSANQMQSYLPLLKASSSNDSIASLYRGVINLQARYLLTQPFCNSFQAPAESGIAPAANGAAETDQVTPPFDKKTVFECKYELDSLAAFLEVSYDYYSKTKDAAFFGKFNWVKALRNVMDVAQKMQTPTYGSDGSVNVSPYTFQRQNTAATETLSNGGIGNPVQNGTGLIRSAFRPSDDSTIYQLFIPANMMFARYLKAVAPIAQQAGAGDVASKMQSMAATITSAINQHAVVDRGYGKIYAFEVDGYGSQNIMDDANIPSLLSAPFFGFVDRSDPVYQNTRKLILSTDNPYWMHGPVFNSVGGPHAGPGKGWPMASIVRILTSDDDTEIKGQLKQLVSTTAGLGLMHESILSFDQTKYTRPWFSWANGLFGQMILDLADRKPALLSASYQ